VKKQWHLSKLYPFVCDMSDIFAESNISFQMLGEHYSDFCAIPNVTVTDTMCLMYISNIYSVTFLSLAHYQNNKSSAHVQHLLTSMVSIFLLWSISSCQSDVTECKTHHYVVFLPYKHNTLQHPNSKNN
jgi:hypothetical protein